VTSVDWQTYPILRFPDVPDVHVALLDHPGEAPVGAGEATSIVIAPAIANAIFAAAGVRVRSVPLTYARVAKTLEGAVA